MSDTSDANGEAVSDAWPPYKIGSRDHLHAVGVLIANWAEVEQSYQTLFQFMFSGQFNLGIRTFELLGNDGRAALIREECTAQAQPQFEDHLSHFLKCAAICKENRNAIAHAHFLPSQDPEFVVLDKGRDRAASQMKFYRFTVEAIRAMADETYVVAHYGREIWVYMELARTAAHGGFVPPHFAVAAQTPPLIKPPQPSKWNLRSQARAQEVQPRHPPSHE